MASLSQRRGWHGGMYPPTSEGLHGRSTSPPHEVSAITHIIPPLDGLHKPKPHNIRWDFKFCYKNIDSCLTPCLMRSICLIGLISIYNIYKMRLWLTNNKKPMPKPKIYEILGIPRPTFYAWKKLYMDKIKTEILAKLSQDIQKDEKAVLVEFLSTIDSSEVSEEPIKDEYAWDIEAKLLDEEVVQHLANLTQRQKDILDTFKDSKYSKDCMFGNDPRLRIKLANIPILEKITPIPRERMVEIFGEKGTGKTTLSLLIAKEFLRNSPKSVFFLDTEGTTTLEYLKNSGLDMERVGLKSEKDAETVLNELLERAKSKQYSLIILDSIANLMPKCEENGELGDRNMGARAFLMNQLVRKITPMQNDGLCFLFTNQVRDSLKAFGSPYSIPGGHAIKHGASLRLWLKKGKIMIEKTKFGDVPNGTEFEYKF